MLRTKRRQRNWQKGSSRPQAGVVCLRMNLETPPCLHLPLCLLLYTHMYVCVCVRARARALVCVYVCMYARTMCACVPFLCARVARTHVCLYSLRIVLVCVRGGAGGG